MSNIDEDMKNKGVKSTAEEEVTVEPSKILKLVKKPVKGPLNQVVVITKETRQLLHTAANELKKCRVASL